MRGLCRLKRVVVEIEADNLSIGWQGVDPLLASRAEKLDRRAAAQLGIVELRDRRGIHDIASFDPDRVGIGGGNLTVAGDVFVKLDVHQPIFLQLVHLARLGLARFQKAQGFGDRNLVDKNLPLGQRRLRDAVAGLDYGGLGRGFGHLHPRCALKKAADTDGVRRVIRPLVDDLQPVFGHKAGRRDLHPASAPAIGHRHFAAGERHLIAGNRDALQDRAADHPFGLFIQIGKVIVAHRSCPAEGVALSSDDLSAALLLIAIGIAVLGPMAVLLWLKARELWRAMIALRDRIDRSKRW